MDLNSEWQGVLLPEPVRNETEPLSEELDEEAFVALGDYDQPKPDNLEKEAVKYSSKKLLPPSLLTSNAERQGHDGKIQQELKGLKELVTSLSQKLETADSLLPSQYFSPHHNS